MKRLLGALAAFVLISGAMLLPGLADTLTTTVRGAIHANVEGANDLGTPKMELPYAADIVMLSGTTDGKANLLWADQRTVAASGNEDLDFAGSLETPVGTAAVFVEVTAILVRAASGNTNNVQISPAASNGFDGPFADASDIVSVQPGGAALFVAPNSGWTVTASTGDLLNIANSGAGTGVTYDIVVIGRDA